LTSTLPNWRYPEDLKLVAVKVVCEPFRGCPTGPETARPPTELITYKPGLRAQATVWYEYEEEEQE